MQKMCAHNGILIKITKWGLVAWSCMMMTSGGVHANCWIVCLNYGIMEKRSVG